MSAKYDLIGNNYAELRKPDPRIAKIIASALGSAQTVLNVGAGTGSYEPTDRSVIAVEPSREMIRKRGPAAAEAIEASADALPFDDKSATIPNTGGRVEGSRNAYVVGWIKRGPTGVIGTNKKDSQDTVDTLMDDLAGADGLADCPDDHADKLADWLASRQPKLVTSTHWEIIDRFERAAGEPYGRPRVKLPNLAELLRISHG